MKVGATVDRLRRSGVEVIDFGAGEPDFSTPEAIKTAAHQALDANFTRYTPVAGIADLKKAICDRYKADYGVDYKENQVIATAGGKQALYNTALSLLERFLPVDVSLSHLESRPGALVLVVKPDDELRGLTNAVGLSWPTLPPHKANRPDLAYHMTVVRTANESIRSQTWKALAPHLPLRVAGTELWASEGSLHDGLRHAVLAQVRSTPA